MSKSNWKYYKELGYEIPTKMSNWSGKGTVTDVGKSISVKAEDLPKGSHIIVGVICDVCGIVLKKEYREYLRHNTQGYDTCKKCMKVKTRETCLDKYNVENISQLQETKDKIKQTNLNKYGVEYGMQSKEIWNKARKTMVEKYGVEYSTQSDEIKNKITQSYINNYGVEYIMQSKEVQNKRNNTVMEKYGVENVSQYEAFKNKRIKTCIERYDVEYPSQNKQIQEKMKNTNLKRYGFKNVSSSPIIRERVNKTLLKNDNVPTSSQQIELHKMIQEKYPNAILNYPFDRCIFDIVLILEEKDIKIDIEYDGWYWHQDKQKDRRRNYYNINKGWKVLRVKSGCKLPSEKGLFEAIDYLINTEHHYKEIILDDWKDVAI